jgi:hypothetical protein
MAVTFATVTVGEAAMDGAGFVVDPELLRVVARDVTTGATTLEGGYTRISDDLAPHGPGTSGWTSTTTAASTAHAWGLFVGHLHKSIEALGEDLARASKDYVVSEEQAQRMFQTRARALEWD